MASSGRRTFLLAVVAILVLLAGALLFTRTAAFERWCADRVSAMLASLGMRVETVRVHVWPDPGVHLGNLSMDDPDGGKAASASSVEATFALLPLLTGRVELGTVRVAKAHVEVEREADGSYRRGAVVAGLFPRLQAILRDRTVHLRELDVVDSSIVVRDEEAAGGAVRARLDGIELHLDGPALGIGDWKVVVRATSGAAASPLARLGAPFSFEATASSDGDSVEIPEARFEVSEIGVAQLRATKARGELRYGKEGLVLEPLRFEAYGGSFEQKGTLVQTADGPRFDGTIRIEGAQVRELTADLLSRPPSDAFDTLSGEAKVAGTWSDGRVEDVSASGTIRLAGGSLPSSSILTAIWHAMIPGSSLLARLQQPTELDSLTMSFTAADRQLETSDLDLVTSDYSFAGGGTIGLDTSLALNGQVRLTAEGLEKLVLMTSLPLPTGELPSLPPIPTEIRGTLADPKVRPNVKGLPRAPLQALFGGIAGGVESLGSKVGNAVGGAARALERGAKKALPIR